MSGIMWSWLLLAREEMHYISWFVHVFSCPVHLLYLFLKVLYLLTQSLTIHSLNSWTHHWWWKLQITLLIWGVSFCSDQRFVISDNIVYFFFSKSASDHSTDHNADLYWDGFKLLYHARIVTLSSVVPSTEIKMRWLTWLPVSSKFCACKAGIWRVVICFRKQQQ